MRIPEAPAVQALAPLDVIRAKEQELARRLKTARQEAEAGLARLSADLRTGEERAQREAAAAAQSQLEQAIAAADQEAKAIGKAARAAAAQAWEQKQAFIPTLARTVVAWVLPAAKRPPPQAQQEEEAHAASNGQSAGDQHPSPS